ncbi:MAG: hypothetical protein K0R93_2760 [Anaerosolibacter sp.]|jgi:HD-GYP domain-containing protein (c-di-GMP phosphodiesterase class II)|uniref:HD domain-containing phosphohydrolase n=1 Tax=Anaerosolibacter sp. TaxID=1872527 RepID=UPI002637A24F|nr:HD domain-containing phosphohydrolase [Anaerosolibacter sp.]MDF2547862.1 hypothetical protein [Anaerosolibacter sp.]
MKISIRKKITIMVLILTLASVSTLGAIVYKNAKEILISDIKSKSFNTLTNINDYFLKNFMDSMEYVVNYWAENEDIVNYEKGYNQPKMVTSIPQSFEAIDKQWQGFISANPDTAWIYFGSEEDGSIFITPLDPTMPAEYDCRERDWYQRTVENNGRVIWTEPYLDAGDSGEVIVTVAKAVKKGEKLVGVIGMDIKLSKFSQIIKSLVFGEKGYLMLIGDKGDIYAHPDKSMLMRNIGEDPWFGKPLLNSNGTDLYNVNDGKQYVVSYLTVPKTGWKLVGIMEVDIGEMIISIKNKVLVIGLVSAIITLVLGYALSLIVTRPVEKIMGVIHTISKGNMGVRVEIDSKDEFKILGDKFNEMLGQIEDLLDERNIHVQELVKKNQEIKLQNEEIRTYSEKSEAMNQELAELLHEIRKNYLSTVKALANSIEANDEYTRGHCERVRNISMEIAKAMGLDPNETNNLEFASVLHDIGKIGIPTEILNKESGLTFEEYENVKSHPRIGFDILAGVDFLNASREIIYQHHERVDGRGYPRGLKGAEINLSAKILAVADAYDAMTSARPYRKVPLTIGEAVIQLQEAKGVQFDNQVVDVLVEILDQESVVIDFVNVENTA